MALISGGEYIQDIKTLQSAGAPSNGTTEAQTVTITGTPTGGTFTLTFEGYTTADIAYNATAATVIAALKLLPNIGSAGIASGAGGALPGTPVVVTFGGHLAKKDISLMTAAHAFTGGTNPAIAVTSSTPGVTATGRGAPKGTPLTDTDNGIAYINTGTEYEPTWTKVGTQS